MSILPWGVDYQKYKWLLNSLFIELFTLIVWWSILCGTASGLAKARLLARGSPLSCGGGWITVIWLYQIGTRYQPIPILMGHNQDRTGRNIQNSTCPIEMPTCSRCTADSHPHYPFLSLFAHPDILSVFDLLECSWMNHGGFAGSLVIGAGRRMWQMSMT